MNNNTDVIRSMIAEVNEENSMSVFIGANTRTTRMMSEFYKSKKKYLIFKYIFTIGKPYVTVSLVVTRPLKDIKCIDNGLTMTDLKKMADTYMLVNGDPSVQFEGLGRKKQLMIELNGVFEELSNPTKVAFKNPVRLGGQTYANQAGYGSVYHGENLVFEGTLYGETTGFCIIGVSTD